MANIVTGPGPVLPPLPIWAQNHLSAIYEATNPDDFNTAFDNFISQNVVSIVVNGETLTRDQYKKTIMGQQFLESSAQLGVKGSVQVIPDANADKTSDAGILGIFFTVTIFERIKIHDASVSHTITSSLNISVGEDPAIVIPKFGLGDRRRVMVLNQVFASAPGTGSDASATSS